MLQNAPVTATGLQNSDTGDEDNFCKRIRPQSGSRLLATRLAQVVPVAATYRLAGSRPRAARRVSPVQKKNRGRGYKHARDSSPRVALRTTRATAAGSPALYTKTARGGEAAAAEQKKKKALQLCPARVRGPAGSSSRLGPQHCTQRPPAVGKQRPQSKKKKKALQLCPARVRGPAGSSSRAQVTHTQLLTKGSRGRASHGKRTFSVRSPRPPATATRAQSAQKHRQTSPQPAAPRSRLPEDSRLRVSTARRCRLLAQVSEADQQSPAAARHLRTGCNTQAVEKPTATTLDAPRLVTPLPDPGLCPRGGGCNPLVGRALPPVWPRSRTNRTQSKSQAPRAPLIAVAALVSELLSLLQLSPKCTKRGKAEPPEPLAARDSPSSSPPPVRGHAPPSSLPGRAPSRCLVPGTLGIC
ncbi:hypothetical protein NN561_018641 [Cricetulus griseus]